MLPWHGLDWSSLTRSVGKKDRGNVMQDELVTRFMGEVWQWFEELSHDESGDRPL